MIRSLLTKLGLGLVFALPLAIVTFALTQARVSAQATEPTSPECQECHAQIQQVWSGGAHSRALSDSVFKAEWQKAGSPKECLACHTTGYNSADGTFHAEGVTCAACHDPVPSNHPLSPATMSRAADMCGQCHKDTFFEWQSSKHGQSDLSCVSCHDPHSTGLRAADASTLCSTCHGTRVASFGHTKHAEKGLTCTDCHITQKTATGNGTGTHTHTFTVDLTKCNTCHSSDLHSPSGAMLAAAVTPASPDSGNSGGPITVSAKPQPVSPLGYAVFTGLIGLAFGMILAPWLERGMRRMRGGKAGAR